jgi:threonine dehydrogenase-like Zn-dependent dehydrogenase
MRCIWLQEQESSLRDVDAPRPAEGEALVRVRLAGICATDLELCRGYYPYQGILGHEFVGEIVEAAQAPERVGQRVVGEINAGCGRCSRCAAGLARHCAERSVLGIVGGDGAFAELLTLPLQNLLGVPDEVADEAAVFTEPLAAALEIQQQLPIDPAGRALVVGAGRLGQLVAATLALTGLEVCAVVRRQRQRALLEGYGVTPLGEQDVETASFGLVVEASGAAAGLALARRALWPRGTLVLKSTYAGETAIDLSGFVVDEITIVGSRCGPFAPALRLLAAERIDPRPLIDDRLPLDAGLDGLRRAAEPGALKVLLDPRASTDAGQRAR